MIATSDDDDSDSESGSSQTSDLASQSDGCSESGSSQTSPPSMSFAETYDGANDDRDNSLAAKSTKSQGIYLIAHVFSYR